MAFSTKPRGKARDPPPSLFLHPSPGASHASLPGILAPGAQIPVQGSLRRERTSHESSASIRRAPAGLEPHRDARGLRTAESGRSADRTDALWAEMQSTLEEVELSASGGTHVFGPEHDLRLSELRSAQIALAQAWARSEADGAIEMSAHNVDSPDVGDELRGGKGSFTDSGKPGHGEVDGQKGVGPNVPSRPSSKGGDVDHLGTKLEEETETDILLARKRREANDEYFRRVNNGVIDVVSKLERVAVAMRAVEKESKDVWNENDGEV